MRAFGRVQCTVEAFAAAADAQHAALGAVLHRPASWPHAASMSSPRVLRIVVTRPASISVLLEGEDARARACRELARRGTGSTGSG